MPRLQFRQSLTDHTLVGDLYLAFSEYSYIGLPISDIGEADYCLLHALPAVVMDKSTKSVIWAARAIEMDLKILSEKFHTRKVAGL